MRNFEKIVNKGFTLIEMLLVVAIIAVLALVVFSSLDPLKRLQDTKDATRHTNMYEVLSAIKIYQIDNLGIHTTEITAMNEDQVYMIVDGNMDEGCDNFNASCDHLSAGELVDSDTHCVDLSRLVDEGYIGQIPISPAADVVWDDGSSDGKNGTGFLLEKKSTGVVSIRSCEAENTGYKIEVSR
jgi:prepilin-type N-terminal cleavage/methylation domain-containing protein